MLLLPQLQTTCDAPGRASIRLSVYSIRLAHAAAAGLLLSMLHGPAVSSYRAAAAACGGRMRAVSRVQLT